MTTSWIQQSLSGDNVKHHNNTVNVKSGESLTPWLQDYNKSSDPDIDSDPH